MHLELIDLISQAGGRANEDRAGAAGRLAWVIDGATDVLDAPMIPGYPSDASWFAGEVHAELERIAGDGPARLADVPRLVAERIAPRFEKVRSRKPRYRHELPSAAGIVVELGPDGETGEASAGFVALADCSLLVMQGGTVTRYGANLDDLGDRRHRATIARHRDAAPERAITDLRASMRGYLQASRDMLNTADGYGVLSVVPPPTEHVVDGRFAVEPGAVMLLASDGFMRLTDVFGLYTPDAIMRESLASGLAPLVGRLREAERGDATGREHPRVKANDDASALLVRIAT